MKYQGVHVGFMFNQGQMPFFVASSYPMMTAEGKVDTSVEAKQLKEKASQYYKNMKRVSSLVTREMRVPKTALKLLEESKALVEALKECHNITTDWYEMFMMSLQFTREYVEN